MDIRLMTLADVEDAERVWDEASREVRTRLGLPVAPRTDEGAAHFSNRIRHLVGTDPDGGFVAVEDGRVVGIAQSLVRDELWILSLFATALAVQGRGLGRELMRAALEYADGRPGMIFASQDPRAARVYAGAGFELHPAMCAWGRRRSGLEAPPSVRVGGASDLDLVADVDRKVRGATRGSDGEFMLAEGMTLLVNDRGYAFVREQGVATLSALDDASASDVLRAALGHMPDDRDIEITWLTAGQQWAVRVCLEAGLDIHPVGPVCVRGMHPPSPYVPTGAFG